MPDTENKEVVQPPKQKDTEAPKQKSAEQEFSIEGVTVYATSAKEAVEKFNRKNGGA